MNLSGYLDLRVDEGVAIVTIDNPPGNALNRELLQGLGAVADELEKDEVLAFVVTGAGRRFSIGVALNEFPEADGPEEVERVRGMAREWLDRIERMGKPAIAAINGLCLGGGLEIALACHWRFCSERARLGFPEINLKLIPGLGGTQRLPRLVGSPKAMEMILTGVSVRAEEALRIGLVDRLFPKDQLLEGSISYLRRLLDKDRHAVSEAIRAIVRGRCKTLEEGLDLEGLAFVRLYERLCREGSWDMMMTGIGEKASGAGKGRNQDDEPK